MIRAYKEGKDLYAVIAQGMYNNDYYENTEFYKEGTEVEIDGRITVAGSGKESLLETDDSNSITVPYYYLVNTPNGDKQADQLKPGDLIKSDIGNLTISKIEKLDNNIKIYC